jgi:hypothetical protein
MGQANIQERLRSQELSNAIRWRIVAVGMLVVGSLVLFMANRVTEKIEKKSAFKKTESRPLLTQVNTVIDTLLDRYQIDRKWVKSWSVFTPDKRFIREERRVYVPPNFISLDFNHDLSLALAKYEARVVATERTRESSVAMHIVSDGVTIESIVFVLKRDLE